MTTKKVIAVVRLNAGQGAYYDELTRIHLTVRHPQANVYAGMNVSGLRRSVKSGRLRLVQGSFGDEEQTFRIGYRNGKRVLIVSNGSESYNAPAAPEREKQQEKAASQETHSKIDEVIEEAPAVAKEEAPAVEKAEVKAEAIAAEAPAVTEEKAVAEASAEESSEEDIVSDDNAEDASTDDAAAPKKTTRRRRSRKTSAAK